MLHGEKVILRAIEREDLPRLCAFNNDVEVELAGGGDPPLPQSLARLQAEFDAKVSSGGRDGAEFAIEAEGKLIGQCALFRFGDFGTCELGITIGDKDYWGRGCGRDAVRVLLDYGFRLRNQRKVYLTVWGNNERAIRAYRACGFIEEGRLRQHVWSAGRYVDKVYMGILRDQWQEYGAYMDWNVVRSRADVGDLLTRFGDFHDSCLREIHIWTEHYVDEDLTMACPGGLDVRARMLFQRQFRDPSAIEVLFEQVTGFHLSPAPENYDAIIFHATLEMREDGLFYWSDAFEQSEDATWIAAKALSWRDASGWMGETLRYGSGTATPDSTEV